MDEANARPTPKPTSVAQRFGGFATAHIMYSLLSLLPLYLLAVGSGDGLVGVALFWWTIPLGLIALYFPLGMFTAWLSKWTPPGTARERRMAVLLPTLVAWTWVCVVLAVVMGEWEEPFMAILFLSFFFAAPSSLLVILLMGTLSGSSLIPTLGLSGLIAGFLPPLLFALGSFHQANRMAERAGERGGAPADG